MTIVDDGPLIAQLNQENAQLRTHLAQAEQQRSNEMRARGALIARLAQRTAALQEMMVVYAGIGHGAGWEIAPENRTMLIAAAELARRALADLDAPEEP